MSVQERHPSLVREDMIERAARQLYDDELYRKQDVWVTPWDRTTDALRSECRELAARLLTAAMGDQEPSDDAIRMVNVDGVEYVSRQFAREMIAERSVYWKALTDIAGWEKEQAAHGPTWREIARRALGDA